MSKPAADAPTLILDAAELCFARAGFDGTTIKEIATEAGVNSALLYYYHADKEALYRAVFTRLIERFTGSLARAFETGGDAAAAIRGFATVQMGALEGQPRLRRLMWREMIDHDAAHVHGAIRHLAATTFDRLTRMIRDGQRATLFRDDVDPRFAAISLVAQTAYFHFARPAVELLLNDGKPLAPRTISDFAAHVGEFTLSALAPHATKPDRPTRATPTRERRAPTKRTR